MHDLTYVVAGYGVTLAALAGYRWRLGVRHRRAAALVRAVAPQRGEPGGPRR